MAFQLKSLIFESHQYIKHSFLNTIMPNELKFHVKTSYDNLAKLYTNCFGHMTKMATILVNEKNPLKSSSPEPEDLRAWYVALRM